jgi:hypothetical protein
MSGTPKGPAPEETGPTAEDGRAAARRVAAMYRRRKISVRMDRYLIDLYGVTSG